MWNGLVERFPDIALDMFVVMPNHLPGIIVLSNGGTVDAGGKAATRPALRGDGQTLDVMFLDQARHQA
jgi:hypothetical protein